jgi:tetratricopeptide (TPR) repeat protein
MKILKILIVITLIICASCSNHQNIENQNEKDTQKEEIIDDLNRKNVDTSDKTKADKQLSDEDLVNKGSRLQMEAGGEPISAQDTQKLEDALFYYRRAMKLNDSNEAAQTNIVTVLCILGRYREALSDLERSTERKENFAEGYSYRGFIYENLNNLDSAQIMYNEAIRAYNERLKRRDNINDEINRAFLLFFVKGQQAAFEEIDYIIEKYPNNNYAQNMKFVFENFNRKEFIKENLR